MLVERIDAFSDNYIWLLYQAGNQAAFVVDPGDAVPVEKALQKYNLSLQGILVTHHHPDHVGGIDDLTQQRDIPVFGPASIGQITDPVSEGSRIEILDTAFDVIEVPGHTLDHIAYLADDEHLLFCGDTLFAGGCGRLFEGSPEQMWHSLSRLVQLPDDTRIYCAHEYTQANLRFAEAVEPKNPELAKRIQSVSELREKKQATVPSTLVEELHTNPFLRVDQQTVKAAAEQRAQHTLSGPSEVFRVIREWKDNF